MTDLSPPVTRGLRYNASDINLPFHRAAQDSATNLAVPAAMDGRPGSSRDPNAPRPDWANPLNLHLGLDRPSSRPRTASITNQHPPCRLPHSGRLNLSVDTMLDVPKPHADDAIDANGYPSPPQSDGVSERSYFPYHPSIGRVTPDSRPPSSRCNAPTALRNLDTARPSPQPRPFPSRHQGRPSPGTSAPSHVQARF